MLTDTVASYSVIAEALTTAASEGATVRIRGGGTKLGWGRPGVAGAAPLTTLALDKVVEHNAGDLTAVVQAGVRLADAKNVFAEAGQMLALDPPPGDSQEATIGGVVATGDSGPLRHRYGGVRDQLIGMRVALPDGSVASSGGKVIKNVAGYDLAKLFAGSFGTLGVIVEVSLRLYPLPVGSVTVVGQSDDGQAVQSGAIELSNSPVRAASLDFAWQSGRGSLLARFTGPAAPDLARRAKQLMQDAGLEAGLEEDDEGLWARQRAAQRSGAGAMLKVSALPGDLAGVIRAAEAIGARAVGRAGLGITWIHLPADWTVSRFGGCLEELRNSLAPRPVVVQDARSELRQVLDVWGARPEGTLALMRRLKDRFDPASVCNRGIFVGGI